MTDDRPTLSGGGQATGGGDKNMYLTEVISRIEHLLNFAAVYEGLNVTFRDKIKETINKKNW